MNNTKIAFIGAGNITQALIAGLIGCNYDSRCIWVSNPTPEKLNYFQQNFGVHVCQSNIEAAEAAAIIVLALKPKIIPAVCYELKNIIKTHHQLVISVAIGATTALMQKWLDNPQQPIIRAMPNTPSAIQCGATGLYANMEATPTQKNWAESLFRSVGITLWVNHEPHIDAVTALSGSGPAYIFRIMEGLQQAGVALGLENKTAELLTEQMVLGAAKMAIESGKPVEQLRQAVTSPQGTTEAALKILEAGNLITLLQQTTKAALARAEEITQSLTLL